MAAGAQGLRAGDCVRLRDLKLSRHAYAGIDNASALGETFSLSLEREQALRYGENPHQTGALYGRFLEIADQLHGKELSFNNVVDISSAMNLMLEFRGRAERRRRDSQAQHAVRRRRRATR